MLQWLLDRQRKHASGLPSYAESHMLYALAHTHTATAVRTQSVEISMTQEEPYNKTNEGKTRSNDGSPIPTSEAATTTDLVASSFNSARLALSQTLPILDKALSPYHPARLPPLLAKACLLLRQSGEDHSIHIDHAQDVENRNMINHYSNNRNLMTCLEEILKVHNIAYGGGVELLILRYGTGVSKQFLKTHRIESQVNNSLPKLGDDGDDNDPAAVRSLIAELIGINNPKQDIDVLLCLLLL